MTPQPCETFRLENVILGKVGLFIHVNGNEMSGSVCKFVWRDKFDLYNLIKQLLDETFHACGAWLIELVSDLN